MNVPLGRLETENQFSLGRSSEISREELNFQKFIDRLRNRFSALFIKTLKKQLMLKGICTEEDWAEWRSYIFVDFVKDNHFTELSDAEMWRDKLTTLDASWQYAGEVFSREFIMKSILKLTEDEVKEMDKQIAAEKASGEIPENEDQEQNQEQGE